MHPNLKKLIDAGVLQTKDADALPQDLHNKISALTHEDIKMLTHMKSNMDPDLFKKYNEFILP